MYSSWTLTGKIRELSDYTISMDFALWRTSLDPTRMRMAGCTSSWPSRCRQDLILIEAERITTQNRPLAPSSSSSFLKSLLQSAQQWVKPPASSLGASYGCTSSQIEAFMTSSRVLPLLMVASIATLTGCGTMANMQGKKLPALSQVQVEEPRPFGGVGRDIRWISSLPVPANLMFVADLPFSLVGDVVTLPTTLSNKVPPTRNCGRCIEESDHQEP